MTAITLGGGHRVVPHRPRTRCIGEGPIGGPGQGEWPLDGGRSPRHPHPRGNPAQCWTRAVAYGAVSWWRQASADSRAQRPRPRGGPLAIVLDTNVVSEVLRPSPDANVVSWLESLTDDVAITAITLAQLLAGLHRLSDGKRKDALAAKVELALQPYRGTGAILPFDALAALHYAPIVAGRTAAGLPISTADAQIAAICRSRGAVCATRNVKDFVDTGIAVIDPWAAPSESVS